MKWEPFDSCKRNQKLGCVGVSTCYFGSAAKGAKELGEVGFRSEGVVMNELMMATTAAQIRGCRFICAACSRQMSAVTKEAEVEAFHKV